jgi:sugar-specific transcriptional regulator TrmB
MAFTTPVVNDAESMEESLRHLQKLGFTDYEARAYVALLRAHPATRYQLSQNAAIPESKIYEVVRRLQDKGVITGLQGRPPRYIPLGPEELVSQLERRTRESLELLRGTFSRLAERPAGQWIWNIEGYDAILSQARELASGAQQEIVAALWHQEADALRDQLELASARNVSIVILTYDHIDLDFGTVRHHDRGEESVAEMLRAQGRWLALVVDKSQVLAGSSLDQSAVGVWTNHSALANIVQRYVLEHFYDQA